LHAYPHDVYRVEHRAADRARERARGDARGDRVRVAERAAAHDRVAD
jgi:hypothetical protein